jgi:type 1 glutamine amidotransferase
MNLNRRQMLLATGAALLGPAAWNPVQAANRRATKKVLFFTKSSGFEHSAIARKGDALSHAEGILKEIGQEHGFEVVPSKDGRLFEPDKIGQWDAFAFMTTGDLTQAGTDKQPPMSQDGKKAFLDAIHGGKGFLGMHCATDTFHSHGDTIDPYIEMIGGEFITHGAQQVAKIDVADPHFPGAKAFGDSFEINDEWYALKNQPDDLHVVLFHDTKGMKGPMYQRPNFPETWARMHGEGRVFYTSMGHREDVWSNPKYQGLLLGALMWATGQSDVDVKPNVTAVTPHFKTLPTG